MMCLEPVFDHMRLLKDTFTRYRSLKVREVAPVEYIKGYDWCEESMCFLIGAYDPVKAADVETWRNDAYEITTYKNKMMIVFSPSEYLSAMFVKCEDFKAKKPKFVKHSVSYFPDVPDLCDPRAFEDSYDCY